MSMTEVSQWALLPGRSFEAHRAYYKALDEKAGRFARPLLFFEAAIYSTLTCAIAPLTVLWDVFFAYAATGKEAARKAAKEGGSEALHAGAAAIAYVACFAASLPIAPQPWLLPILPKPPTPADETFLRKRLEEKSERKLERLSARLIELTDTLSQSIPGAIKEREDELLTRQHVASLRAGATAVAVQVCGLDAVREVVPTTAHTSAIRRLPRAVEVPSSALPYKGQNVAERVISWTLTPPSWAIGVRRALTCARESEGRREVAIRFTEAALASIAALTVLPSSALLDLSFAILDMALSLGARSWSDRSSYSIDAVKLLSCACMSLWYAACSLLNPEYTKPDIPRRSVLLGSATERYIEEDRGQKGILELEQVIDRLDRAVTDLSLSLKRESGESSPEAVEAAYSAIERLANRMQQSHSEEAPLLITAHGEDWERVQGRLTAYDRMRHTIVSILDAIRRPLRENGLGQHVESLDRALASVASHDTSEH